MKCGLLGEKLAHSYSPAIHRYLGDYEYRLIELPREKIADFIRNADWNGLNVTIPYKKDVFRLCDEVSPCAAEIESVNTIIRRSDGSIFGDNTDLFGFDRMLTELVRVADKKVLVLGSGGASVSVCAVLREKGAHAFVISRSGEDNYTNIDRHADAAVIVNTTPVGMYPNNGASPVDLRIFTHCEAVLDLIYNPAKTALLLQAERLGIPNRGGLSMLVAQAKRSAELFLGQTIPDGKIDEIESALLAQMRNIVLIGMPGCGKTSIGRMLSNALSRPFIDTDEEFSEKYGSPAEFIQSHDENAFRLLEHECISEIGKSSGIVISTGGGCVMNPANLDSLRQNGIIIRLLRDVDKLARAGRPLSSGDLSALAEKREPFYRSFADITIDNNGFPSQTVQKIMEAIK